MIEGNKVWLRPITTDDTDNIVKWRNSALVRPFFIDHTLLTREIHENWLETRVFTGNTAQFIIVSKEDDRDVGTVYLRDIDKVHRNAEFGIYIGDAGHRQKGLGLEAAQLICRYGFEELGLHRIFLRVLSSNTIAIHCYEKAGFQLEGVFRQHAFNGESFCDVSFMGCLNPSCAKENA